MPRTKESGKPVMHHYTSDSLVEFSCVEHDPDCPGCEIERLRDALVKIETNSECSIGSVASSKHHSFCAYHTARTALDRRP